MKSKALVLACLLLLPGTRSNAGAWPQPVDRIEVIVQAQISHSDEEYNFQGDRQDRDPFRKVEFSAYSEWGLWSDLTLLGEIAYSNEQTETVFGDIGTTALRRIELGARYHLFTLDLIHRFEDLGLAGGKGEVIPVNASIFQKKSAVDNTG